MATGSVVVVGGTRGLGREVAQHYADAGREVVITGREQKACDGCAVEIGGATRAIAFDLAEPHSIAERLGDVGDVQYVVPVMTRGLIGVRQVLPGRAWDAMLRTVVR